MAGSALVMEGAQGPASAEPPACAVTLAMGGAAGPAKTFTLRMGDVLRVGRGAANDFVLALGGISTCHAELFLRPSEARDAGSADLYVRDTSKNGTGVQRVSSGVPAKWQALPRGGLLRLQSGWRLLLPLKGLPKESAELAHTMTVSIAALPGAGAEGQAEAAAGGGGGEGVKTKTPLRKPREKKAKAADGARKRKHAERDEALAHSRRKEREVGEQSLADPRAAQPGVVPQRAPSEEKRHRKHRRVRRSEVEADPERRRERHERKRRRREADGYG